MLANRLEDAWRECRKTRRIDPIMRFTREGLVLGAGTVLVTSGASERDVTIDPLAPRLRALLAAAHLVPPRIEALAHLRSAADAWRRGDSPLAAMHLVLSGLDRLQQPQRDSHRLFLAEALLGEGVSADTILAVVETGDLQKFDPDQPRVPAGSGRTSGQWTNGDAVDEAVVTFEQENRSPAETSDADNSASNGPRPIPNAAVNQVRLGNPNLQEAATQGRYAGPDACYRAKKDCWENAYIRTHSPDAANDNWDRNAVLNCSLAEDACLVIGFAVDTVHFLRRGAVLYPDGGVVIADKGNPDDYVYYPSGTHRTGWPFIRSG
jgi:hypothetical protein